MISLMYLFMAVVILLLNYAALALVLKPWIKDPNLARFWGLLLIGLLLVFMGYTLGLAHVAMLWPISTAASCYALWRRREQLLSWCFWREDYVFFVVFLFVLAWRVVFPDISPNSPQMGSLHPLANFYHAQHFPPQDLWLGALTWQHQPGLLAALMAVQAKYFSFSVGLGFNLAWATMMGLMAGLLWSMARNLGVGYWSSAAAVAVILLAGTGVAPLVPLLFSDPINASLGLAEARRALEQSLLFVGDFDRRSWLAAGETTPLIPIQLPSTYFLYGVFHPVLQGTFMALAMVSTFIYAREQQTGKLGLPWVLLGMMLPILYLTSGYALVLALVLLPMALLRRPQAVLLGACLGLLLLLPMLLSLSPHFALPNIIAVTGDRVYGQQLLLFWPLLVLLILAGLRAPWSWNARVLDAAVPLLLLWLFSHFYTFDDLFGGRYERYTTGLHLWSLWYFVGLAWLLMLALSGTKPWQRVAPWFVVVPLALAQLLPMAYTLRYSDISSLGKIRGDHAFSKDRSNADLLNYLRVAPRGVMLESQGAESNAYTGRFALFTGQPTLLAWPSEQRVWRNNHQLVNSIYADINRFYSAQMTPEQMLDFLQAHRIRHVLWQPEDVPVRSQHWQSIHDALLGHYQWVPFFDNGINKVGTFERLDQGGYRL